MCIRDSHKIFVYFLLSFVDGFHLTAPIRLRFFHCNTNAVSYTHLDVYKRQVKNGVVLPMMTSCSPGWIKYCEHYYPELIPHLSTCKSPQQMFGATMKTWYAKKLNMDPDVYKRQISLFFILAFFITVWVLVRIASHHSSGSCSAPPSG